MKIILPIDTKSLYMNIKNDNSSGHTATVATPLKQGNSYNEQLGQILNIKENEVYFENRPQLINELVKNSKSEILITNVFVFDKISVNGMPINTDKQFCVYIKKEIDPNKAQFGRLKVHYPMSLKYEDEELAINNKSVLASVSGHLHHYAFIITQFEYDTISNVLNFKARIVGENQVPYSKVFINNKGVGSKFTSIFNEVADDYDVEIISLRKKYGDVINTSNFNEYMIKNKSKSMDLIKNHLLNLGFSEIYEITKEYPYALYDISYNAKGIEKYALVYYTSTSLKYFNISRPRFAFCNKFNEFTNIFLITNIEDVPQINKIDIEDLESFNKTINSIKFTGE